MHRLTAIYLTLAATLALSGCLPTPGAGVPTAAPEPPSSSPSPSPVETEPPAGPIALPACADLYTPEQVSLLIGDSLVPEIPASGSDGGYGTQFPALRAQLLRDGGSVGCTWVLPGSERGLTVSYVVVTPEQRDSAIAVLAAEGLSPTPIGSDFSIYAFAYDGEYPFTEAHGLGGELWVCANDGFGVNAPALVQAALDRIIELNPGRF